MHIQFYLYAPSHFCSPAACTFYFYLPFYLFVRSRFSVHSPQTHRLAELFEAHCVFVHMYLHESERRTPSVAELASRMGVSEAPGIVMLQTSYAQWAETHARAPAEADALLVRYEGAMQFAALEAHIYAHRFRRLQRLTAFNYHELCGSAVASDFHRGQTRSGRARRHTRNGCVLFMLEEAVSAADYSAVVQRVDEFAAAVLATGEKGARLAAVWLEATEHKDFAAHFTSSAAPEEGSGGQGEGRRMRVVFFDSSSRAYDVRHVRLHDGERAATATWLDAVVGDVGKVRCRTAACTGFLLATITVVLAVSPWV